jgi:hypothetical protein
MMIGGEMQQGAGTQPVRDAAVDRRPWAAYVLGHRPYALQAVLENWWEFHQGSPLDPSEVEGPDLFDLRDELEKALRILLLDRKLDGAVYVDYRRALDRFVSACRDVAAPTNGNDRIDWSSEQPPGGKSWEDLIDLSAYLVVDSDTLQGWRELGEVVGKSAHYLNQGFVGAPSAKLILELVDDLGKGDEHAFLKKLKDGDEPRAIYETEAGLRFDPEQLDVQVRYGLLEQELPSPLLVLSQDEFVFYGKSVRLDDLDQAGKDGVAIIRVLAERAGKFTKRDDIIKECKIQTDKRNLKVKISRFRTKYLKPAIEAYFARSGGDPTSILKDCHIQSDTKRGGSQLNAYRLRLKADRIRIIGPRPDWMKPNE